MIIGIDARFALHKLRGVGNYSASLIKYLLEADKTNRYILYTDRKDSEGIFPRQSNLCVKNIGFGGYFIWEQILLPLAVKKDKVDILHCLANTAPLFLPFGIKLVSTLHDVSYLKPYFIMPRSPYLYQRLGRIYRKIIVPRSLRKASAVITVSEFAKQDILTQIPYLDKNKVFITYEATDDNFKIIDKDRAKLFVRCKYGIKGKYIINVGGRDPQKNTSFLIESFLELKKQNVLQEQIVIIGFKNSRKASIYKKLINTEFKNQVHFIDYASKSELLHLYNGSEALIFPSLYESFGIPLLEAMACGIPVIASTTGAIPEIVGDAAILVDPRNKLEFKEVLLKLLADQEMKNYLSQLGFKRVKNFSWERTARETLNIYLTLKS